MSRGNLLGLFGFGKYSDRAVAKAAKALSLRAATDAELFGEGIDALHQAESLSQQGRFEELEALYRQAWESKVRHAGGARLYSEILIWAVAHEPESPEALPAYLEPFAAGFAQTPTVFMAGLYSTALQQAASVARGTEYARDTSSAQFAAYDEYNAQALDVLEQVGEVRDDDFVWWGAFYSVSSSAGHTPAEREKVFERVLACDPGNITLFYTAMISALPRWRGTDEFDAERVAQRAMELNQDEWGAGGYAMAYSVLVHVGDLEASDTAINIALAEQGFRDLMERSPSLFTLNKFASTMSWAGAESVVKEIFDGGLHQISLYAWDCEDEAEAIETAARAYVWAQHNA